MFIITTGQVINKLHYLKNISFYKQGNFKNLVCALVKGAMCIFVKI